MLYRLEHNNTSYELPEIVSSATDAASHLWVAITNDDGNLDSFITMTLGETPWVSLCHADYPDQPVAVYSGI